MRDNFWDTHPDAITIEVFRVIKEKKGEDISSNIMWYIRGMHDPGFEYLKHVPPKERGAELKKYYNLTDKDIKLSYVQKAIEWYLENWLSPARRLCNSQRDKVYEAEALIRSEKMTKVEDIIKYGEIQKAFGVLKSGVDAAEASLKDETAPAEKKGTGSVSAADSGELWNDDDL